MARRRHGARPLSLARPPVVRELSAGGLVYRRRGGGVFVVLAGRRHPESGALVWTIPKGHVEAEESPRDAAVREVREETGLEGAIVQPLGDIAYSYIKRDGTGSRLRVFKRVRFFLMRWAGGCFADRDEEMDAVRWFGLEEAEAAAAFADERALVRRAGELLGGEPGA